MNKDDDVMKARKKMVSHYFGVLLKNSAFQAKIKYIVTRKLGGMLVTSDAADIAQDAISHVMECAIAAIHKGTTKLLSEENLKDESSRLSKIEGYLIMGITNYCNTRLYRWSTDQAPKTKNDNEESEEKSQNTKTVNTEKKVAVRARACIESSECPSDSDFWDQHISTSMNEENLDFSKAIEIINSKGLTEEQIELILDRISGVKFSDMAKQNGGTEDQYRKAFNRAMEKMGVDKKLVL